LQRRHTIGQLKQTGRLLRVAQKPCLAVTAMLRIEPADHKGIAKSRDAWSTYGAQSARVAHRSAPRRRG
jgi:hypothetical protein